MKVQAWIRCKDRNLTLLPPEGRERAADGARLSAEEEHLLILRILYERFNLMLMTGAATAWAALLFSEKLEKESLSPRDGKDRWMR